MPCNGQDSSERGCHKLHPASISLGWLTCSGSLYRQTQERLALLYYFSAHYQDALEEVDMILAADADASQELQLFRHKLLLWKALECSSD